MLNAVRRLLGVKALPRVLFWRGEGTCITPVAVGIFRPSIVLSRTVLDGLDADELRDVLVHECAHAFRRGPLVGLFQRIAEIAFWPYPLVRLMNRHRDHLAQELLREAESHQDHKQDEKGQSEPKPSKAG